MSRQTSPLTLSQLAELTGGTVIGDGNLLIERVVHPMQVKGPNDLALILDVKLLGKLAQLPLQTILLPQLPDGAPPVAVPNQLIVPRPKVALAKLLDVYKQPPYLNTGENPKQNIHPTAIVHPSAQLDESVQVGPYATIGPDTTLGAGTIVMDRVTIGAQTTLGQNCRIYPGVVIGDDIQIGNHVIIQPNAVIGCDGFSYVTREAGSIETARASGGDISATNDEILRIESIGTVVLEDHVEIGAGTTVDRATLGETRIKAFTKIDNQVQIAHNVTIERNCLIASQVGIAGSAVLEEGVVAGGQAGVKDHARVGAHSILMAQSGITCDLAPKTIWVGTPGMPHKEFTRNRMHLKSIKGLKEKLNTLSNQVEQLAAPTPETAPV